jgi:hypothetical protein
MSETEKQSREESEQFKRLNILVSKDLHHRVQVGCALESRDMRKVVIELLEQRFPAGKPE